MLVEDAAMPKEAARVAIHVSGGATFDKYVPHATGSIDRPMSDEALSRKFHSLAEWGWPECDTAKFIALAWSLETLADVGAFARAGAPCR